MGQERIIYIRLTIDGVIVGCATGGVVDQTASLDNIQIEPRFRGRGYGSQLLRQFLDQAIEYGATEVRGEMLTEYRMNIPLTIRFYERHGISVDGQGKLYGRLTDRQ